MAVCCMNKSDVKHEAEVLVNKVYSKQSLLKLVLAQIQASRINATEEISVHSPVSYFSSQFTDHELLVYYGGKKNGLFKLKCNLYRLNCHLNRSQPQETFIR